MSSAIEGRKSKKHGRIRSSVIVPIFVIGHLYFIMTQSVAIEKKSDTPLDKVNGISCIMIPWMNQKRIPANNNDVVHRDMSLDSFSFRTLTIWGIPEKVVRSAAR